MTINEKCEVRVCNEFVFNNSCGFSFNLLVLEERGTKNPPVKVPIQSLRLKSQFALIWVWYQTKLISLYPDFIPNVEIVVGRLLRRLPPTTQRGRFYGPLPVFTFPNIHRCIFGFLPHSGFCWLSFFLAWQLGFLLVRLALVCYLCGFGFHLICTGCLHISALIYCCGERGKCDSS